MCINEVMLSAPPPPPTPQNKKKKKGDILGYCHDTNLDIFLIYGCYVVGYNVVVPTYIECWSPEISLPYAG